MRLMETLMKIFTRPILPMIVALMLLSAPIAIYAQQYAQAANNTTTNGAITAASPTVVLTSATAIAGSSFSAPAAGQCIYFADGADPDGPNTGELARITAVSSTTMTLNRSAPRAHATATRVFTAACAFFKQVDPPSGSCTANQQPLPWINVFNGNIARCMGSTGWSMTNATAITYNSAAPGLPW